MTRCNREPRKAKATNWCAHKLSLFAKRICSARLGSAHR